MTQDVLLRVLEQTGSFAGKARFSTWIFRLTINLASNQLKAAQLRQGGRLLTFPREEDPEDLAPGPEEAAILREESARLDSMLQGLPCWREMTFYGGLLPQIMHEDRER